MVVGVSDVLLINFSFDGAHPILTACHSATDPATFPPKHPDQPRLHLHYSKASFAIVMGLHFSPRG